MAGEATRNKDKAMAARMKKEGVVRTKARCPVCNRTVSVRNLYQHIVSCN